MNNKIFLGIDPGASGAMCGLQIKPDGSNNIIFLDNKTNNVVEKNAWLTRLSLSTVSMCMIENVHSIPGAAAKASFNFGWNVGELHTLLALQPFGFDLVTPKTWQKAVGVYVPAQFKGAERKKRTKNHVAEICERLYPGCPIRGSKGGLLDGRSDALAICHYARLKYSN